MRHSVSPLDTRHTARLDDVKETVVLISFRVRIRLAGGRKPNPREAFQSTWSVLVVLPDVKRRFLAEENLPDVETPAGQMIVRLGVSACV
jgi:hypothetical protein